MPATQLETLRELKGLGSKKLTRRGLKLQEHSHIKGGVLGSFSRMGTLTPRAVAWC